MFEDTIYDKFVSVVCSDRLGVDSIGDKIEGTIRDTLLVNSFFVARFRRV